MAVLLSFNADADIYENVCTGAYVPIYGGYTQCLANGPPGWPQIYLEGTFSERSYSSSVSIRKAVSDNCVGTTNNCPVVSYSCTATLPLIQNRYTTSCNKKLLDSSVCDIPSQSRVNGGYRGIAVAACQDKQMCWDSSVANTNWCYVPKGRCNIAPANRIDGGWSGITESQCTDRGMCWNDSSPNTKWCFVPN
jgi:hypothetical protein